MSFLVVISANILFLIAIMPKLDKTRTFLDPITLEDIDIHDESAVFYLLVLPNNAGFKFVGSTQNLNSPQSRFDPEILNHADMSVLFPDDKLRSEPFKTLDALNAALRLTPPFDPMQPHEAIKKHTFGPDLPERNHRRNTRRIEQQPRRQQPSSQESRLNIWQTRALNILDSYGLTEEMLLTHQSHGHSFENNHTFALIKLVTVCHFSVPEALAEIEGLTNEQAQQINEGSTRDDVINPDATRPRL